MLNSIYFMQNAFIVITKSMQYLTNLTQYQIAFSWSQSFHIPYAKKIHNMKGLQYSDKYGFECLTESNLFFHMQMKSFRDQYIIAK